MKISRTKQLFLFVVILICVVLAPNVLAQDVAEGHPDIHVLTLDSTNFWSAHVTNELDEGEGDINSVRFSTCGGFALSDAGVDIDVYINGDLTDQFDANFGYDYAVVELLPDSVVKPGEFILIDVIFGPSWENYRPLGRVVASTGEDSNFAYGPYCIPGNGEIAVTSYGDDQESQQWELEAVNNSQHPISLVRLWACTQLPETEDYAGVTVNVDGTYLTEDQYTVAYNSFDIEVRPVYGAVPDGSNFDVVVSFLEEDYTHTTSVSIIGGPEGVIRTAYPNYCRPTDVGQTSFYAEASESAAGYVVLLAILVLFLVALVFLKYKKTVKN